MQPKFEEYTEMVGDLAAGGFTAKQSETLVTLLARLFSQQGEFFEQIQEQSHAHFERTRREDKEDRERIRHEDKEDRARLEAKLDAAIAGMGRWMITTLATLLVSVLGAAIFYSLRTVG